MLVVAVVDFMVILHQHLVAFLVEKVDLVAVDLVVETFQQVTMKEVLMEFKVSVEAAAEAVMNTVVDLLGVVLVVLESL